MRVDSHHHLWNGDWDGYGWLNGDFAPLRRPFVMSDLRPHLGRNLIDATIVVQAMASTSETIELLAVASEADLIAGVVGWIDLDLPDFAGRLETVRRVPGGDLLVGLRHAAADESEPDWLSSTRHTAAFELLAELGLTFDLEVTEREMASARTLALRHPTLRFVLDHLGKPPIKSGWSAGWQRGVEQLAALPNIFAKVSGLVTEANWESWQPDDLQPYVGFALAVFGVDRLMFGSDWPVCDLAAEYDAVVAAATFNLRKLTAPDLERVFGRNAIDFYQIKPAHIINSKEYAP